MFRSWKLGEKTKNNGVLLLVAPNERRVRIEVQQALLTLIDPQLGNKKVPMQQTAPGRYVASVETPNAGAYHIELAQKLSGQPIVQQSRGEKTSGAPAGY